MKFTGCIIVLIFLSSCNHYYYVPSTHNVPLLKEKGQLNLSGNVSIGEESGSTEGQAAYALTEKVGVMVNYMSSSNSFQYDDAKGFLIEGAAGLYKPVGDLFVAEAFAGTGYSKQHHSYFLNGVHSFSNLSFVRSFVQGDLGISQNIVDVVLSGRFCHVGFTNINSTLPAGNDEYMRFQTVRQGSFFLAEPALTVRVGFKFIKLNIQLGGSYCLNGKPAFEQNHLSGGLSFCIAKRFRRVKTAE